MVIFFLWLLLGSLQDPVVQQFLEAQRDYLANPASEDALIALVSALYQREQNERAIRLLQPFVNANPKASRARLFLALGYAREEKYDQARTLAEQVAREMPKNYYAQHVLALSLSGLNRYDEAEASFKRALELKPDFADAHFQLGLLYARKRETLEQARASLQRALEFKYPPVEIYKNLGSISIKLAKYDAAVEQLNQALQFNPEYTDVYFLLADALRRSGAGAKAAEAMKRFQVLNSAAVEKRQRILKSVELYQQGVNLLSKDELAGAYDDFKAAVELHPQLDSAHYRMAQLNYLRGDAPHALENIRNAIEVNPFEPEYYFVLSRCLEEADLAAATEAAQKAISLNPGVADFHNLLGILFDKAGDYPRALQSFKRATELEPENEAFRLNLSTAQQKLVKKN